MVTVEECEQALHRLAQRLADAGAQKSGFDRTLSCQLSDPQVNFAGRLQARSLTEIRQVDAAEAAAAKVRLKLSGEDLLQLVDGDLNVAGAWASGRVKIDASVLDLMKLRSIF